MYYKCKYFQEATLPQCKIWLLYSTYFLCMFGGGAWGNFGAPGEGGWEGKPGVWGGREGGNGGEPAG